MEFLSHIRRLTERAMVFLLLLIVAFVFVISAASLQSCSALSGLTGSTTTTPDNPTGLSVPTVAQTNLAVAVPAEATVASNCVKGDQNSCDLQTKVAAFCKANTGVSEALKPCTAAGWM